MPRGLRIEFPGAIYHVLNRGNYRDRIFDSDKSKQVFEDLLFDACKAYAWKLYAYCTLGNHYHLSLETMEGNLSSGMQWLQATYANKVNKFRGIQGHLFQGRFKSILVDKDSYLGPLLHYIHLNPLRAKLVDADSLLNYRYSSLWYFSKSSSHRPECLDISKSLYYAGNLADTPKGRSNYHLYLKWLSQDNGQQKELGFAKMCRGWALGSKEFKEKLLEHGDGQIKAKELAGRDISEAREVYWGKILRLILKKLNKGPKDIITDKKGCEWKVMIAHLMKRNLGTSNSWLVDNLKMGTRNNVSRNVTLFERKCGFKQKAYKQIMLIINT